MNPMAISLFLGALLAAPAAAQPRQNLREYLTETLNRDRGFGPAERDALISAVASRFADYSLDVMNPPRRQAADVVLRMFIEGSMDQTSPERSAEVGFAAYQAIRRGAPPDVVEGIALYGFRKRISGERISVWANGYQQAVTGGVRPAIAADLVRNAMEHDWEDSTFNTLKWALVDGVKDRFNPEHYATYLFGHMLQDKSRPGALVARARPYFMKLARTKAKPDLPPYEGVFTPRKPPKKIVYEAKPAPEPPAAPAAKAPAAPPAKAAPQAKPTAAPPAQAVKRPAPAPMAKTPEKPAPAKEKTPRDLGLTMTSLWPGLDGSSRSYLGTPYVWGGVTHKGIDCSALTQNSYSENTVSIPRVSRQQWKTGDPIDFKDLREGDLVFFNTMGVGVSHVGMVTNPGRGPEFIHASSSKGVTYADLSKNYYKARYLGARRIVP